MSPKTKEYEEVTIYEIPVDTDDVEKVLYKEVYVLLQLKS